MSDTKKSKSKTAARSAAIDSVNEVVPPLDFSFCRLGAVADALDEEPRIVSPWREKPRKLQEELKEEEKKKSKSRCFRLNNNAITDVSALKSCADDLFEDPENIGWLDLSFNDLTSIEDVLLDFVNVQILYLHGNSINTLEDVLKLAYLPKLRKLSLHGNPIENIKGYRQYVLAHIPQLQVLDFSNVTKSDRVTASTWSRIIGIKKKTKKSRED